jgi:hypothetical protein
MKFLVDAASCRVGRWPNRLNGLVNSLGGSDEVQQALETLEQLREANEARRRL